MYDSYVENNVFKINELEKDIFVEEYINNSFEYAQSLDRDRDIDNAAMRWEREGLFEDVLTERFMNLGYEICVDDLVNGYFVWIQALNLLMVCPRDEIADSAVESLGREDLYDVEYASGSVVFGRFFVQTVAKEIDR